MQQFKKIIQAGFNYVKPLALRLWKTRKLEVTLSSLFLITFINSCALINLANSYKATREYTENEIAGIKEELTEQQLILKAFGDQLKDFSGDLENIRKVVWDLSSNKIQMREGNYQTVEKVVATGTTNKGPRKVELTKEELYKKADTFDTGLPATRQWEADAIAKFAKRLSDKYSVPIHIIYTLIGTESSFKYNAKNPIKQEYGRGLMQVSDVAFEDYKKAHPKTTIKIKDLETSIECNMEVGVWYYQHIYNDYAKKDPSFTWRDLYGAYNVGYTDYKNNKDSYLKGWDNTRNQPYNALKNWDFNYSKVINHFFC